MNPERKNVQIISNVRSQCEKELTLLLKEQNFYPPIHSHLASKPNFLRLLNSLVHLQHIPLKGPKQGLKYKED